MLYLKHALGHLAGSIEHMTLNLGIVGSNPTLGVEILKNKKNISKILKILKNKSCLNKHNIKEKKEWGLN